MVVNYAKMRSKKNRIFHYTAVEHVLCLHDVYSTIDEKRYVNFYKSAPWLSHTTRFSVEVKYACKCRKRQCE